MSPERPLGSSHVAAVVIGAIIGVGIFFTPATLARALPSPAWVLGIWLLGGIASVAGALVFADLGARFPRAGGFYVFLRDGFGPKSGPFLAFEYGWMQMFVIQPGAMAIVAVVLVDHIAYLTGPLPEGARAGSAALVILTFTAANLLGLPTGGRIQIVAAAFKVAALALLVAIGIGWGDPSRVLAPRASAPSGNTLSWMVLGLIPVLFSFGGAYHATFIAGAVRDPSRSLPRGILGGIGVVLVAYLAVNVAYLGLLGHDGLAASQSPAADATARAIGPLAGKALAAAVVLSAAGILNTVCLGFPFMVYAMAKDGLFFKRAGELDERTGRPALAVGLQGLFACVAVFVGASRVDVLLNGIAFADAAFQAAVAVVCLRAGRGAMETAPGVIRPRLLALAAFTFLILELGVAVGCLLGKPIESAYGAAVLAAGAVAWWLWKRGR